MQRKRVVESFASAAEAIGPIERGMSVFAVTRGQFSMLDAVLHCLTGVGRARISVWTWTIADYEIEAMEGLIARDEIEGADLVIDMSADRRNATMIDRWRARFGPESVKVCRNHAKIARIYNDDFKLLARGSMNLNFNPRFEQFDLTEGGADFDLVTRLESELAILPRKYANADVDRVTGLGRAFEQQTLSFFHGAKPWAK